MLFDRLVLDALLDCGLTGPVTAAVRVEWRCSAVVIVVCADTVEVRRVLDGEAALTDDAFDDSGDVADDDRPLAGFDDDELSDSVADADPSVGSATATPCPVAIAAPRPIATAPTPTHCEYGRWVCFSCRRLARRVRDVRLLAMVPPL